jgi:hypothetical protein
MNEWLPDGIYSYSVFTGLYILVEWPVNLNIPASELQAHQNDPNTQNGDFLEDRCNDSD